MNAERLEPYAIRAIRVFIRFIGEIRGLILPLLRCLL